jgi:hypothetical protein
MSVSVVKRIAVVDPLFYQKKNKSVFKSVFNE